MFCNIASSNVVKLMYVLYPQDVVLNITYALQGDHDMRKRYQKIRRTKKLSCPVKMYIYEIVKFCEFRVSVSWFCSYMFLKFCASLDGKVSLKLLCREWSLINQNIARIRILFAFLTPCTSCHPIVHFQISSLR